MSYNPSVEDIRNKLASLLREYGVTSKDGCISGGSVIFVGEPEEIVYFDDIVKNGGGDETLYFPDDGSVIEFVRLIPEEKEAFDIDPQYTAAALTYNRNAGFINLDYATEKDFIRLKKEAERLEAEYGDSEDGW